ncbi:DUF4232 domain-containing protein [Saccharopolyspora sp. MS10]|uniref:DUF4232 domain-containing protein n=1 Tax=Saccharopolyspora sp. MS10 TaxID=3385973 RepID=UPI0039A0DE99
MLRTTLGALALAGTALTLTACGAGAQAAQSALGAQSGAGDDAARTAEVDTPRCGTGDLNARFGGVLDDGSGQLHIQLEYTNVSDHECVLRGAPGVDLIGPVDPVHGATYSVPRVDDGDPGYLLTAGERGMADLTVLPDRGPEAWRPTELITTPPGQEDPLRIPWSHDFGVVRQDGATHPGTYVHNFKPF